MKYEIIYSFAALSDTELQKELTNFNPKPTFTSSNALTDWELHCHGEADSTGPLPCFQYKINAKQTRPDFSRRK